MAKNTGLIKFTGKLGNLSGRNTQYGNIISTPGGFKGERIRTEERYEATRQLGSEFGRCSKISSVLHTALHFHLQTLPHSHMYGSIQSLVTLVKGCDTTSMKGKRSFGKGLQTERGRKLLLDFSFNPEYKLRTILKQHPNVALEQGMVTFPSFDPGRIAFPEGVEQLGLQLLLLHLDTALPSCKMESSALVLASKKEETSTLVLEAALPKGEGFLLALVYAGFCNEKEGEVYFLKHPKNVLEVVGIF